MKLNNIKISGFNDPLFLKKWKESIEEIKMIVDNGSFTNDELLECFRFQLIDDNGFDCFPIVSGQNMELVYFNHTDAPQYDILEEEEIYNGK